MGSPNENVMAARQCAFEGDRSGRGAGQSPRISMDMHISAMPPKQEVKRILPDSFLLS